MRRLLVLSLIAVFAVSAIGLAQGTKDHPYKLVFVPSTDPAVVSSIGDQIAAALTQITGLEIEAYMVLDDAVAVSEFANAEGDVFGFPNTVLYLDAFEETLAVTGQHLDLRLLSVRNLYTGYWAAYYVRRADGYTSLEDLNGKIWGYSKPTSTSGYQMPKVTLDNLGVVPSDTVATQSHNASMVALYNGDVDFCTGYFSPPKAPAVLRQMGFYWQPGDPLELGIWNSNPDTTWGETAGVMTGPLAWYCQDLRQPFLPNVVAAEGGSAYPDILEKITVLALSDIIPNDGCSFVPGFPEADKELIVQAIKDFITTPEGVATFGNASFYEWDDVVDATDRDYDNMRKVLGYPIPVR
jgi:phosphonate transport system substrate-binding protein